MATLEGLPSYAQPLTHIEGLSHEDFETASIRSAAPSYVSDAPSYHTTVSTTESIPAYTPRSASQSTVISNSHSGVSAHARGNSLPSLLPSRSESSVRTIGLPPVPSGPRYGASLDNLPSLAQFRIPSWSSVHASPNARHYQNVAHRRVAAARADNSAAAESMRRLVLERIEEEERNRFRPLEDPHLVGEQAASRARAERLARENGDDILIREDRRWDSFLAQMNDWDERERSWKKFRREVEQKSTRGRWARAFGSRAR